MQDRFTQEELEKMLMCKLAGMYSTDKFIDILRKADADILKIKLSEHERADFIEHLPQDMQKHFTELYADQSQELKELDFLLVFALGMGLIAGMQEDDTKAYANLFSITHLIETLIKPNKPAQKRKQQANPRKPKLLQITNDHYTNNVLNEVLKSERNEMNGNYKPAGNKEISFFTISTVDDTALNTKRITEYDRHLQNCIGSLMDTGQDVITLDGLCRLLIDQNTAGGTHSSQRIYLWERLKEQAKIFQTFTLEDGRKLHGTMISFMALEEPIPGEPVGNIAIKFTAYPILFNNAYVRGQMLTVPLEYLKVYERVETDADGNLKPCGKRVLETPERIAIKSYMLRRTALITSGNKKSNLQSNRILFDTVFSECGLNVDRRNKGKYVSYIELLLQNWKAQGFIHGYCIVTKGRTKAGIEINPKTIPAE